ncbi:MAG: hypothetical protein F6K26_52100 [Moorea sp. SIO2I5]|nr:hypothetical protein [Moorena sp. SIO2I5]
MDASTLEALFRKLKSLEAVPNGQLGGRICAVIDLETRFPVETWFEAHPYTHESNFLPRLARTNSSFYLADYRPGFLEFSLF